MQVIKRNNFIKKIEKLCKKRKVRMTSQRIIVLYIISQQKSTTISAYNLLDLFRIFKPKAKPSTIYRTLNFLLKQKFIHRVESTNSFILCQYFTDFSHCSTFFICDKCGYTTEETIKNIEKILFHTANMFGFSIVNSIVETHGFCSQCSKS